MLAPSGARNTPGKSVTTLIVSIGLFHRDEMVAPRLHHGARRDAQEPEQPLAVVGAPPRHHQRPRHHLPLSVHHRSEEHTSELQSRLHLVCRLLLEKKKIQTRPRQLTSQIPPRQPQLDYIARELTASHTPAYSVKRFVALCDGSCRACAHSRHLSAL